MPKELFISAGEATQVYKESGGRENKLYELDGVSISLLAKDVVAEKIEGDFFSAIEKDIQIASLNLKRKITGKIEIVDREILKVKNSLPEEKREEFDLLYNLLTNARERSRRGYIAAAHRWHLDLENLPWEKPKPQKPHARKILSLTAKVATLGLTMWYSFFGGIKKLPEKIVAADFEKRDKPSEILKVAEGDLKNEELRRGNEINLSGNVYTTDYLRNWAKFLPTNEDSGTDKVTGLVIGSEMIGISPQPDGLGGYVTNEDNEATRWNENVLLAHNYLSGESFSQLQIGSSVAFVTGEGEVREGKVAEVIDLQALTPNSGNSEYLVLGENTETGTLLTGKDLLDLYYENPDYSDNFFLQTCISNEGISTWGRRIIRIEIVGLFEANNDSKHLVGTNFIF